MSIEFYVYSEKTSPPDFASVSRALQGKGWHTMFLDSLAKKHMTNGALDNNVIYGARDPGVVSQVRGLVSQGDEEKLEVLFEEDKVGGCGICASLDFNAEEEYGDDLSEQFPPEIKELVLKAKSHYSIRTSAGRGELAFELQVDTWEAIGQLVNGILEDPQSGRYLRMGPDGREVLWEAEVEEGSPVDSLVKFFDAAKAAGFPVEAKKNEDVSLHTEQLSQPDLERLLKFTRDHFAPEEPAGPAMVMMILEEYRKKKGRAFASENAAWLEEMQQKYAEF